MGNKKQWNVVRPRIQANVTECRAFARETGLTELEDQVLYACFSINQCILLLAILHYVGWKIGGRLEHRIGKPDPVDVCVRLWYHVLNFSEEIIS